MNALLGSASLWATCGVARGSQLENMYTDDLASYRQLADVNHKAVKHSVGQYVDGAAHTNGIESFWSMLKRGYTGTYHKMSVKHLHRYVNEFAGRANVRELDTLTQMAVLALGMRGKGVRWQDLTADPV